MYKIIHMKGKQVVYTEIFEKLTQAILFASRWAKLHRSASKYEVLKGIYDWKYFRPDMLSAGEEKLQTWFDFKKQTSYVLGEFLYTVPKNKNLKGKTMPKGQYQIPTFWIDSSKIETLVLEKIDVQTNTCSKFTWKY